MNSDIRVFNPNGFRPLILLSAVVSFDMASNLQIVRRISQTFTLGTEPSVTPKPSFAQSVKRLLATLSFEEK